MPGGPLEVRHGVGVRSAVAGFEALRGRGSAAAAENGGTPDQAGPRPAPPPWRPRHPLPGPVVPAISMFVGNDNSLQRRREKLRYGPKTRGCLVQPTRG